MKSVAVFTNTHERCGNFRYADDLRAELAKFFLVEIVDCNDLEAPAKYDAVVVSHTWGRTAHLRPEHFAAWRASGTKIVLIDQESKWQWPGSKELAAVSDAVVAHDPLPGVTYIPHGIPEVSDLPPTSDELLVGTAGFPFPWKRSQVVAQIAKELDCQALVFAPNHDAMDFSPFVSLCRSIAGDRIEVITDWLPTDGVVRKLARCTANVFWFSPGSATHGQSGSARLGVAAQRPVIASGHGKLTTLLGYGDEFYVADSFEQLLGHVRGIWNAMQKGEPVRIPRTALREQGWSVTGKMYAELIRGLLA